MMDYTLIPVLNELAETIQPQNIVSRTFYKDEHLKAILSSFDAGLELSEHTSGQSAVIKIVQGNATVTLGNDVHELSAGAWGHMSTYLKHNITTKTPLVMLLLMFGVG